MTTKKVLIVEDDENLLLAITSKLKKENINFIVAKDGEQAIFELKNNPDVIWLDLYLPKMNGFDFLRHIKSNDKYKDIPVFIVSNSGSDDKMKEALELGVVDYMIKDNYSLKNIINKIIGYIK